MNRNFGQAVRSFKYNADGIRTSKISDGVEHVYTLNGTQIVSEKWSNNLLVYLYDETGAPIGMQYRQDTYTADQWDTYYFEKDIQGNIIAVYSETGRKLGTYTYDAWGQFQTTLVSGTTSQERRVVSTLNPFRYRGYYYDVDTGLYYLQSRYYDPLMGRFINADGDLNANGDMIGFNMYAYCSNNPATYKDETGRSITLACIIGGVISGCIVGTVGGSRYCQVFFANFSP